MASSQRTGETTTNQFYDFEDQGQYAVRVSNIEGSGEWTDYAIQVTPEFPLHVFASVAALCWHNSYAQVTPGSLV